MLATNKERQHFRFVFKMILNQRITECRIPWIAMIQYCQNILVKYIWETAHHKEIDIFNQHYFSYFHWYTYSLKLTHSMNTLANQIFVNIFISMGAYYDDKCIKYEYSTSFAMKCKEAFHKFGNRIYKLHSRPKMRVIYK